MVSVVGVYLESEGGAGRPDILATFFVGGYSLPLSAGIWMLLSYFRHYVTVAGDEVCLRGITYSRQVSLREVKRACWSVSHHAGGSLARPDSLKIFVPEGEYTVKLGDFHHAHRLVRYLHEHLPGEIQENWGLKLDAFLALADQMQTE